MRNFNFLETLAENKYCESYLGTAYDYLISFESFKRM